ncbi:hypothetical protein [Streptomyces sp. NPDC016845]
MALLVELLTTMGGGAFSLDAPPFDHGNEAPPARHAQSPAAEGC